MLLLFSPPLYLLICILEGHKNLSLTDTPSIAEAELVLKQSFAHIACDYALL